MRAIALLPLFPLFSLFPLLQLFPLFKQKGGRAEARPPYVEIIVLIAKA